jgi:hypothetical protein
MKASSLRDRGLLQAPFESLQPGIQAAWRRVLVETLGGVDDGATVHVIGSVSRKHIYTLVITPVDEVVATGMLCLRLNFGLTVAQQTIAEGTCSLRFSPSTGVRPATIAELAGTVRWATSRLRRFRLLGPSFVSLSEAVGSCYQDYLSALRRTSIEHW